MKISMNLTLTIEKTIEKNWKKQAVKHKQNVLLIIRG